MSDQQGYWLCPNCGEVPGEQVTYEEYHNICGSKVTEMLRTPPTIEEAELWRKVIDLMQSAMKKGLSPEEYISLMQGLGFVLSRRSEQNSEAVELLNWMAKNHVICAESANGNASFVLNEKIATKEDLHQEFQLFKQKQ